MAGSKLSPTGYCHPYRACGHFLRGQGPSRYLRSINGHWGDLRADVGHNGEGHVSVCDILSCAELRASNEDPSAYPQSGIFAFCKPDVPCITPGTYAFLGAAAALRCVQSSWDVDFIH